MVFAPNRKENAWIRVGRNFYQVFGNQCRTIEH